MTAGHRSPTQVWPRRGARLILLAAVTFTMPASVVGATERGASPDVVCRSETVPVRVDASALRIAGTYCRPSAALPRTVFLLIPGGSYNRVYWDFPYRPAVYSFNRAMARAGYASFAIDRLGTGASSKPLSWLVTSTTEAGAIHQVVQHLRKTGFDDGGFRTILVGGHSLGSWIGVIEAATFRDVDGVLLTGFGHRFGVTSFLQLAGATYPAFLDPKFSGEGLDPGYVTTQPGTRESAFYAPGRPDPDVVRVDEETKDVASVAELADGLALATLLPYSSAIDVPVLLVVGQSDPYFCGGTASDCSDADTLAAEERPLYGEAPCLAAAVIPDIGHDVNLFPSALGYQALVADWARALVAGGCPGSP